MFRLKSFRVLGHPVFGNIHIRFGEDGEVEQIEDIYTSVIIGANGIGKSYLLRAITEVFCYIKDEKAHKEKLNSPKFRFGICYAMDRRTVDVTNYMNYTERYRHDMHEQHLFCMINGETVSLGNVPLPAKVIASTMTITDKFVAKSSDFYIYKGVRNEKSPSTTGTRTMIRKTVSGLFDSLDIKVGFQEELKHLLENMGLEPRLTISYSFRHRDLLLEAT